MLGDEEGRRLPKVLPRDEKGRILLPSASCPCRESLGEGRASLPSASCTCRESLGGGRVSLPPAVWFAVGLGVLIYLDVEKYGPAAAIWKASGAGGLLRWLGDLSNMSAALIVLAGVLMAGGVREYVLRREKTQASEAEDVEETGRAPE